MENLFLGEKLNSLLKIGKIIEFLCDFIIIVCRIEYEIIKYLELRKCFMIK